MKYFFANYPVSLQTFFQAFDSFDLSNIAEKSFIDPPAPIPDIIPKKNLRITCDIDSRNPNYNVVTSMQSIPTSGGSFSSIGIEEAPSHVAESISIHEWVKHRTWVQKINLIPPQDNIKVTSGEIVLKSE